MAKAVVQKMLDNHLNLHRQGDLKGSLKKLNRELLRPKGRNTTRSKYNRRIKTTQQRIEIISKLLEIAKPNPDTASSSASSDGFNPDTVNLFAAIPDGINPVAVNPDAVNPDAVDPDAVNPGVFNPDAANPEWTNPALGSHTLEFTASASLQSK